MRIRVIFSPVWLHEEALARLPAPLHLGRSVSRLPNCLNSRARMYRVMSDPLVITIRVYTPEERLFRIPQSSLHTDVSREWISMRISRRESIRLPCSRDSSTRWGIERGAARRGAAPRGILRVLRVIREYRRHILKHLNSQR